MAEEYSEVSLSRQHGEEITSARKEIRNSDPVIADNVLMNIEEIIKFLPHRYPFLLVDKILTLEPGTFIHAIKNVTINEPFFMGHFPTKPVMPGVLMVEALAQTAAVLAYKSTDWSPTESLFYLGSIDNTRFKKVVVPGDQLHLQIEVIRRRKNVWKFKGQALVDSQIACVTEMTSMEGKA